MFLGNLLRTGYMLMKLFYFSDVHSGERLPEVELISLVEEQIPKYKLRADTLTSFTGVCWLNLIIFC